jgi:hypothetical protein
MLFARPQLKAIVSWLLSWRQQFMSNRIFAFLSFMILVLSLGPSLGQVASAQQPSTQAQESEEGQFKCSQRGFEQNALIREAERDTYTTRRVEFIGNNYTRDGILRRRIIIGLQEGDLFTRHNLIRSLQNVSKLKVIYPARLRDVVIQLDRPGKMVDMIICFREKRRLPTHLSSVTRKAPANKALQLTAR